MKILIDADACPVIKIAAEIAARYELPCLLFCDDAHELNFPGTAVLTSPQSSDSADLALVNQTDAGDIVITQDYGLAALCLSKRAHPLNQNGLIYTNENIDSLLLSRHTMRKIRRHGGRTKGPAKRTPVQDQAFAQTLEGLIKKLI